jgi:hypothetical protein
MEEWLGQFNETAEAEHERGTEQDPTACPLRGESLQEQQRQKGKGRRVRNLVPHSGPKIHRHGSLWHVGQHQERRRVNSSQAKHEMIVSRQGTLPFSFHPKRLLGIHHAIGLRSPGPYLSMSVAKKPSHFSEALQPPHMGIFFFRGLPGTTPTEDGTQCAP